MTMGGGMNRLITIFVGAIILFVVVCPFTPTPVAVLNGKAPAAHALAVSIALPAVLPVPRVEMPVWATALERAPTLTGGSVVDLTCSRLC